MAKQNRTTLKGYFETGDIPNQNQYADLIDSNLNLSETSQQELAGGLNITGNITSSGALKSSGLNSSGDISCGGNSSCNGSFSCDGNISSSADVISNNITATNITASGNISSSGTLVGNKLIMDGGGVTTPSISFRNDSDTGISSPSANTININVGGSTGEILVQENKVSITGAVVDKASFNVSGHITASGNISANKIVANRLESLTDLLIGNNYKILPVNDGSIGTFPFIHFNEESLDLSTAQGETLNLSDNVSVNSTLTVSSHLTVNGAQVNFSNLPTSDPSVAGRLWNDSGTLKISAG